MADFIATQRPSKNEMAYGPQIISTYDNDGDGFVHALRILQISPLEAIAELRQSPNSVGYAHFDISKILQTRIDSNPQLPSTSVLANSANECYRYLVLFGYINASNEFTWNALTGTLGASSDGYLFAYNGRKPFYEVEYDSDAYVPEVSFFTDFNVIDTPALLLTDRTYDIVDASTVGTKPAFVSGDVVRMQRRLEDGLTLSYMNQFRGTPLATFNGINSFTITAYDSTDAQILSTTINNLTGNGGGPNVLFNDETILDDGTYGMISINVGNTQTDLNTLTDLSYYYVSAGSYFKDPDTSTALIYPWKSVRVEIDNGECNDFENIQVAWVNSLGAMDYFDFQKRNDFNVNISREEYKKTFSDWSEATYAPSQYDRGSKVFNTSVVESYIANTRYLTDDESIYLKNLFISPEVQVRFGTSTEWIPVILTSNSWNEKTFRKDKLFQHTINFKLANQPEIQNG